MNRGLILGVVLLLAGFSQLFAQNKVKAQISSLSINSGKQVYAQYCLSCHQVDGLGVPNMNPPLAKTSYVSGDKVRLIKVVLKGFVQNVDIDGESYSNNMPPHNFLTDRQIADVLTYIRNSFGNAGSAITVPQVNRVRHLTK